MCFVKCALKLRQDLFLLKPTLRIEMLGIPENSSLNRNVQTDKNLNLARISFN